MRFLTAFLVFALTATASVAQHDDRDDDYHHDDDHYQEGHHDHHRARGLVLGIGGSALVASGDLSDDFGETNLGVRGFIGYRANPNLTVGIDVGGYELDKQGEFAETDSGLLLDVTTTTSLTRVAAFGRYGAPFGSVTPFAEVQAGIDVVSTTSRLGDTSEGIGQTQEESIVPSFGGGVGVDVALGRWPLALQVRASHVIGGEVDYLVYDPEEDFYFLGSGNTTSTQLTVGVTYTF